MGVGFPSSVCSGAENLRVRSLQQAVVFVSAGLLVAASLPLAHDAVIGTVTAIIVVASVLLMVLRKADPLWIVVGAALASNDATAIQYALELRLHSRA